MKAESSTPPMVFHAIKVDGDSSGEKRMSTDITVVKNDWKEVSPDHFTHSAPFNFAMVDDGIYMHLSTLLWLMMESTVEDSSTRLTYPS
nr:protein-tyrosine phosphatase, dual specificity phosphatase, eukaryotic [Tanacetum cinerariifolium]